MHWSIHPYNLKYDQDILEIKNQIEKEYDFKVFNDNSLDMSLIKINSRHKYWILNIEDTCVGMIGAIQLNNSQAELKRFYLLKEYRSNQNQFAQKLFTKVLNWCEYHKTVDLFLGTMTDLKAANRFYVRNGFKLLDHFQIPNEIKRDPLDDLFYKKKL